MTNYALLVKQNSGGRFQENVNGVYYSKKKCAGLKYRPFTVTPQIPIMLEQYYCFITFVIFLWHVH